jgi:myosin-crossreactive antigen
LISIPVKTKEQDMAKWIKRGEEHRLLDEGRPVAIIERTDEGWQWELKIPGVPYQRFLEQEASQAFLWANRAYSYATGRSEERPLRWCEGLAPEHRPAPEAQASLLEVPREVLQDYYAFAERYGGQLRLIPVR